MDIKLRFLIRADADETNICFWIEQFDMYMRGCRGIDMHDTTLVIMSNLAREYA
jgi:hypothetical protein